MTWFRVDDEWFCHPKVMGLGLAARGLWVTAGSWCANRLTDGFVPSSALSRFGATKRVATELVAAGLWLEVENGYQFWDWLHFQPSKEKVLADRSATSRRVSKHRNGVTQHVTNGGSNGHVTPPPVPGPVPSLFSSENSQTLSTAATSQTRTREEPEELQQFGDFAVLARVRSGYEQRLAAKTGQAMPQTRWANEAIATIAKWVSETAGIRGCDPSTLADQLLEAYFASPAGAESRFKAITLAGDPARYLEPPQKLTAAPAKVHPRLLALDARFDAMIAATTDPAEREKLDAEKWEKHNRLVGILDTEHRHVRSA